DPLVVADVEGRADSLEPVPVRALHLEAARPLPGAEPDPADRVAVLPVLAAALRLLHHVRRRRQRPGLDAEAADAAARRPGGRAGHCTGNYSRVLRGGQRAAGDVRPQT